MKQGIFLVGMGDKFDLEKTRPMVVGDTGTAPAGMGHYAAAKGATIDEPWGVFPYGY